MKDVIDLSSLGLLKNTGIDCPFIQNRENANFIINFASCILDVILDGHKKNTPASLKWILIDFEIFA